MSDPTDTPSTDGAPDPASVIANSIESHQDEADGDPDILAAFITSDLDGMGFRVVPEDRPAQCDCERFGFKVPGHAVGSNWDWVPCPEGHGPRTPTDDEALVTQLRDECLEFHGEADGITHDCAYVRAADRIIALAAGVPALDDDTRRERLIEALDEFGDKVTQADAVIHLGRVQPEPFKSQMLDVAHALDEAQRLIRRAAAYLGGTER